MQGPVFFVIVGVSVTLILVGLGWWLARRLRGEPAPEVRDAPIPVVSGPTSDPFAQHWSQRLLDMMEWKRHEDVMAGYIRHLGFEPKTESVTEDGVLEMHAFEAGATRPTILIQCKAWNRARVDDATVRAMHAAMRAAQAEQAAFFNTGGFTPAAVAFAEANDIDLVSGAEFLSRLGQLPLNTQNELLDLATDGEYTTPTCPACSIKMIRRVTVTGPQAGVYFWGCRNYPKCSRIFAMT
jgi:restriction system protein